ncbi:MAG: DUF2953 domain-containing protein [Elusimicrobiota bacterium]
MIIFIPVVYSIEGAKEESYFFTLRISWLGKMISFILNKEEYKKMDFFLTIFGFRITLQDHKKIQKKRKKGEIKKRERKRKKEKQNINKYFSFFQRSFLDQSFRLIRRVFRHIMPKEYHFHLIYGFEDPADTGMLTGLFYLLFPTIFNTDMMKINPVFDKEMIQGEISIKGRIIIFVLIYYFLQFYFARGIRQTIRKIRNK